MKRSPASNRLVTMVITLSRSKAEKDAFREDPEAYMRRARLGPRQKEAIRKALKGDVSELDAQFRAGYRRTGNQGGVPKNITWKPEALFW